MKTPPPYDLIIGLDRSDRKAELHLIDTLTDRRWSQSVDTAPEALWEWLLQLRQLVASKLGEDGRQLKSPGAGERP